MVKPTDLNMLKIAKGLEPAGISALSIADMFITPAKSTFNCLVEYIQDFEDNLDEEHEIGARLVSFGSEVTFHIEDMESYGPDIITFFGINNNGEKVQLIQNISQLNVLLVAMKKMGEKAVRIGFKLSAAEGDEETE